MNYKIRIFKFDGDSKVKAFVSVTFEEKFVVTGLRVVEGVNGLFVSMPNRKDANGSYKDTAYPVTKEFRDELFTVIIKEYENTESKNNQSGIFAPPTGNEKMPWED
jgi:stage V sporulation protein G